MRGLLMTMTFAAASAGAANLALQVSSETAPPGGFAQFKVFLTAPNGISSAGLSMNFDPAIFGNAVGVSGFAATGDQTGYFYINGQQVTAYFTSAAYSIGQLPELPVFVVTVPVLASAKLGTTSSITVDAATFPAGSVSPGTFTCGRAVSVQSVTPGGGLLPAGAVVTINGTGFDATTAVTIDGVSIASTQLVSATEINVTLGGATEMTGKHVHVGPVDYFSALSGTNSFILPSLPPALYTTVNWDWPDSTQTRQDYSCLQNNNAYPVTATYAFTGSTGAVTVFPDVVIPPNGLYVVNNRTFAVSGLGSIFMVVSAPIRMAEIAFAINQNGGTSTVTVTPPRQAGSSLGGISVSLPSAAWNWQIGTVAPKPQTQGVVSGFPFTISISNGLSEWLQVTRNQPSGAVTEMTLTPLVSALGAGTYTGTVTLTPQLPASLGALTSSPTSFSVTINVSAQPTINQPLIETSGTVSFTTIQGTVGLRAQTFPIGSDGAPAAFTTSITGGNWVTVTPSSGSTPATLTVSPNPAGLAPGIYIADLKIQGPINAVDVGIELVVISATPGPISVSPASLSFTLIPGSASPGPQTISIQTPVLGPTVTVATQSGGNWLMAGPNDQFVEVNASAVNLSPGTYQGSVTITSATLNLTATVPVMLAVIAPGPGQLSVSPSSLTLTARVGTVANANLNVALLSGAPFFTLQIAPQSAVFQVYAEPVNPPPAYTTPPSYTAPLNFIIHAMSSEPGTFVGTIAIAWNGGSATIPVAYYATASATAPPVMAAIVGSGSAVPGAIAPGELISIFGEGLGAAPASLTLTGNLKVITTLGGTQVLVNGTAVPLIYTSTGQVNAVVPYEVTGSTATVQVMAGGIASGSWVVPVAAAAPSIFTTNGSGVGQGAIVNSDGSVNGASNPASRGSVIQVYATGGGQTSPASSTGAVATGAANLTLPYSASIGGVAAQVLYAGSAPGEVDGVVQLNVVVPAGVAVGSAVPVVVTVGGVAARVVTVAVN